MFKVWRNFRWATTRRAAFRSPGRTPSVESSFYKRDPQLTTEVTMKMRTSLAVLAAATLFVASAVSAAVAAVPSSGTQVPASSATTNSMENGQRVIFFNEQGKQQSAPSHYAELWGEAASGG
jgi:hypothetical protein